MSDQIINDDINDHLAAIDLIVDTYQPFNHTFLGITLLSTMTVCLLAIFYAKLIGLLLVIVSVCGNAIVLSHDKGENTFFQNEKKLSKEVCRLMSHCVLRYKNGYEEEVIILNYSINGNLPLYQEFVAIFPHMASTKLRRLSKIKFLE